MGVSPFIKIFRNQSVIDACVLGEQYDLLEYLIKDTRKGINNKITDESKKFRIKYKIENFLMTEYYWKSREGKDENGNNTCHLAFEIMDRELRYKVLKLLIEENVGDINKHNVLGYLPHEVNHNPRMAKIPLELKQYFLEVLQETEEADYLIITNETNENKGKTKIIIS